MKKCGFLLFSLLIMAACHSVKTYTDYDNSVSFSHYTSYAFFQDMETGMSPLNENRFAKVIDTILQRKNFQFSRQNPDLRINFYSSTYQQIHQNNIGIGIGTYGGHVAGNIAGGIPIKMRKQLLQITVEVVDAASNALIWQGVAEVRDKKGGSPDQHLNFYRKIAQKLLRDFPPQKKAE